MRTSAVIIAAAFIAASPALAAPLGAGPGNTLLRRETPDLEARLYE